MKNYNEKSIKSHINLRCYIGMMDYFVPFTIQNAMASYNINNVDLFT